MPALFDVPQHEFASLPAVAGEVRQVGDMEWGRATRDALRYPAGRLWRVQLSGQVLTGTTGDDTLTGGAGDDTLYGLDGNDLLLGEGGNDTLYAGDGDDILAGGSGDDALHGELGNDAYVFGLGDGHDRIHQSDVEGQFLTILVLKPGVHPDQVQLERDGLDLVVRLASAETVTLAAFFPPADDPWQWPRAVDQFWFQEGAAWEMSDILARLPGAATASAGWRGGVSPVPVAGRASPPCATALSPGRRGGAL
ncbi:MULTISPECIES: calcium-binding protein [Lysobacter]|uniref:Calcium-binding protein n=1 Tax=Lysobacter firmicutimachus TaxID=1792846 RepID=A0ABU8D6E4_9GAMM|nr:calcium-binding protein [Lysobacter antibioticus]